jgi:hypothetical protein
MSKRQQSGTLKEADEDAKKLQSRQKTIQGSKAIPELVARFKKVHSWHVGWAKFNGDTFKRKESEHRKQYKMTDLKPVGMTFNGLNQTTTGGTGST